MRYLTHWGRTGIRCRKRVGGARPRRGEAGLPGLGGAKGSGAYESRKIHAPRTTLEVLNDGEDALLLILDEAQTVAEKILNEHHPQARIVLDKIHNGDVDRPVILAAGGLSTTSEVFHDMGVSRFEARSFVGLGRTRGISFVTGSLRMAGRRRILHHGLTRLHQRPAAGRSILCRI